MPRSPETAHPRAFPATFAGLIVGLAADLLKRLCLQGRYREPPKADIGTRSRNVRFVQKADIAYSITSSAVARSDGGTVKPRFLAVFRLTAKSNFVGNWIGSSLGSRLFKILSTKPAAFRKLSLISLP